MTSVRVLIANEENKVKECIVIPADENNLEWGLRQCLNSIYGGGNVVSCSREIGAVPDNIARYAAENYPRRNKGAWMPFKPSWAAPAVNNRYLVKMRNGYIVIATYFLRVGGGYWKNDSGQELADGVVEFWRGLDE